MCLTFVSFQPFFNLTHDSAPSSDHAPSDYAGPADPGDLAAAVERVCSDREPFARLLDEMNSTELPRMVRDCGSNDDGDGGGFCEDLRLCLAALAGEEALETKCQGQEMMGCLAREYEERIKGE